MHSITHTSYDEETTLKILSFLVTNTLREPIPGWADNLNGPIGICVALIKGWLILFNVYAYDSVIQWIILGVLRTLYADGDVFLDIVPADATVNALLMITCETMEKR